MRSSRMWVRSRGEIFRLMLAGLFALGVSAVVSAEETSTYVVQPGDVLLISVWKEPDLVREAVVRPDGNLSFPLAGEIEARNKTIDEVQKALVAKIEPFIPEPAVSVMLQKLGGNLIYVVGKVNRPGEFQMASRLDVIQGLALAGGLATFADEDDISVLRREGDQQQAIKFDYSEVVKGKELGQNILLQPGDVIVVP